MQQNSKYLSQLCSNHVQTHKQVCMHTHTQRKRRGGRSERCLGGKRMIEQRCKYSLYHYKILKFLKCAF